MRSYIIRFMTILCLAMTSSAWAGTFVTALNADETSPVFATPPTPQAITGDSAVIAWSSDKISDSRVYFGETLPLVKVAGEIEYAVAHSVKLTKLQPNTTYSYQVVSVDPMGNQTTSATQSFTTLAKGSQTISFGTAPIIAVGGTGTVLAMGGASGNVITFSSSTPDICTVSGSTVSGVASGTCTIAANQAVDASYNPAEQVTQDIVITVGKTNQTVIFGAAPTLAVGVTGTLSASASSGLGVSFSSSTPSICTVSGSIVTGVAAGTCTVAADQTGDANHAAAIQVTQNITVGQAIQNLAPVLAQGWNLLGNSLNQTITVATVFGDPTQVTTVWKWGISPAGWQFYAPSMDAASLQAYATNKGYGVLSTINPGEGYWVNARTAATLGTQSGTAFNLSSANLATGWNLAATGNDISPSAFNLALSASPPAPGTTPINLTTLWAWDNISSRWYFYAPSLESGGTLAGYITSKGYLDFAQHGKTLGQGVGFWVNKP